MDTSLLKYILFVQNITCVFRNIYSFKIYIRVLIYTWITTEIAFVSWNIIHNAFVVNHQNVLIAQMIYYYLVTGFSVVIIIAPLCHSKNFYYVMKNVSVFRSIFSDEIYFQTLLKAQDNIKKIICLYGFSKLVLFIHFRIAYHEYRIDDVLNHINLVVCESRFVFEFFAIYAILNLISKQINSIIRSIDSELSIINSENKIVVPTLEDCLKKLCLWTDAYNNIISSAKICNKMFSAEVGNFHRSVILYIYKSVLSHIAKFT